MSFLSAKGNSETRTPSNETEIPSILSSFLLSNAKKKLTWVLEDASRLFYVPSVEEGFTKKTRSEVPRKQLTGHMLENAWGQKDTGDLPHSATTEEIESGSALWKSSIKREDREDQS